MKIAETEGTEAGDNSIKHQDIESPRILTRGLFFWLLFFVPGIDNDRNGPVVYE